MNGFVSGKVGKLELGHLKRKHNRVFPSKVKENTAPEPLSLVQNRVRLPKKNLKKSTLALPEGPGEGAVSNSEEMHHFLCETEFYPILTPSFLFLEGLHCCYIYFHCSHMYNYYNYLEPCALNAEFQPFHTQI
jgi:hypothetical protein